MGDDDHAFLGHPRPDVVDHLEARREPLEPPQLAVDLGDPRIAIVRGAPRGGRRVEHLPGLRHAIGRILGQQPVQQRGSAARHARDEDRPGDVLGGDSRIATAVLLDAEAIRQHADDVLPHHDTPQQVETGLGLQRVDQSMQALEKRCVLDRVRHLPAAVRCRPGDSRRVGATTGREVGHPRSHPDRRSQRRPGHVRETRHSTSVAIRAPRRESGAAVDRARHARRPGTPKITSRARPIRESASAASGGTPRSLPSTR